MIEKLQCWTREILTIIVLHKIFNDLRIMFSVETNNEEAVHHAVSFAAANTYIGLPQMKAYNSITIRFLFRTFESNGLLMYNAGKYGKRL